jgi:hypothetical protein
MVPSIINPIVLYYDNNGVIAQSKGTEVSSKIQIYI